MAYIEDDTLLEACARRRGTTAANLVNTAPQWAGICEDANEAAYQEIRTRLVARGFAVADIDTWDRRAEFNRRIGVCFAFRDASLIWPFDEGVVSAACNCVDELDTVTLLVDGEAIDPTTSSGGCSSGALENDLDVFTEDM